MGTVHAWEPRPPSANTPAATSPASPIAACAWTSSPRAATRILSRVVRFEGTCLLTVDPATLLPTGEVVEDGLPPAAMVRFTEIELKEPDFNKFVALAHAPRRAASLGGATEGELDRSLRQREVRRPNGFADELRAVLADETGSWGALTLLREANRPLFTATDVRFVASLAELLADGLRRAMLLGDATVDRDEVGLAVLAPDNTIEMANHAADLWFGELDANGRCGELPLVVHSVATRTRHAGDGVARAGSYDRRTLVDRARFAAARW